MNAILWLAILFWLSPVLIPLILIGIRKTYKVLLALALSYIGMLVWFQIDNHNQSVARDSRNRETVQTYETWSAQGHKDSELDPTSVQTIKNAYIGLGIWSRPIQDE